MGFSRRIPKFKTEKTVLIICEDSKSSKTYLEEARAAYRVNFKIEIIHTGNTDPLGIVNAAVDRLREYEEIYCVIDRDTHANFDEALRVAVSNPKIRVLPSYPCFEYWLLLHFVYTRKPFERAGTRSAGASVEVELRAQDGMKGYQKGRIKGLFAEMQKNGRFSNARSHAERSLNEANESGSLNPSTTMHLLFDRIEQMTSPTPLK